jgi:hypothetical protein
MNTIDHRLAHVRADLRAAVQRDIRRRSRRRRIARLGVVPAVVLATAGAAVAIVPRAPQLADPAPESLIARLNSDLARTRERVGPKVAEHIDGPQGGRLTLAAIGEDELIYGDVEPSGAWCAVRTSTAGLLHGWVCHEAAKAGRPDEVVFVAMGGGSTRAENVASGRVGEPSARTVRIHVPGHGEPVVTLVQRLGFFVARLPDSTLGSQLPVALVAEALDADGTVVARSTGGG